MSAATDTIEEFASKEYKYGFVSEVESDTIPVGLSEDVIRTISSKKNEPEWLLEFRLKAYKHWLTTRFGTMSPSSPWTTRRLLTSPRRSRRKC